MTAWIFVPFLVTLLVGVPIAFALGISATTFLIVWDKVPFTVIAQRFYSSVDVFVLLSIPFFILAGELMNKTGITTRLVKFAGLVVGRLRGGLAQANIGASILFAGLTGAGVSDTSAIGSILIPAMKEDGFEADYSAAVTAASSVIGPIIPPSIIMVVFGSIMGISIGALFAAGFVPGILVGLALMIMAYIIGVKRNHPYRKEKVGAMELIKGTKDAVLALLMPVIIIGGILSGVFTPTEAAAVATCYALVVGFFVFKTLKLKDIPACLLKSATTTSILILIVGFASVLSWTLSIERIPQALAKALVSANLGRVQFLLLVNVLLLFMGMIMETGANAILLGPILMPLAIRLGIHPVHFALIMLVNLNIGLATPPLGVCLFVACPIAGVSMMKISKAIAPFIIMEIAALMLITFIPDLVLFVPRLLGFA
jgi:TRAP-type transport system large permease protein